jgi:hypothetical protein
MKKKKNKDLLNLERKIFRTMYLLLTFLPLVPFIYSKLYNIPYLDIPSFLFYSFIIFVGILSYSERMFNAMSKNEEYLYNITYLVWPKEFRFFSYILIALTFVTFDYTFFGFLLILASGGEITIQQKVINAISSKK